MKTGRLFLLLLISLVLAAATGCGPSVRIQPDRPLVARDLIPYQGKRVAVLAFREPETEPGLGNSFAATLHWAILREGPFAQASFHPESVWFGLQSNSSEELATAAAMAADLGADLAIVGRVERFAYSRTSDSILDLSLWVIDTVSGEILHAERISARGKVRNRPPVWEPGLSRSPERRDMFDKVASELVFRMGVRWDKTVIP